MYQLPPSVAKIVELEVRQDAALRQLEDLERQVERALLEFSTLKLFSPAGVPQEASKN